MGIGVVIAVLAIAGLALGRAGSGGWSLLFFATALALFVSTPAGSDLPGQVQEVLTSVGDATGVEQ